MSDAQEVKSSGETAQEEDIGDAVRAGQATSRSAAAKLIRDFGDGGKADDAVRRVLLDGPEAPESIFEILRRLRVHGGQLKPHLVVNGGHENPARTRRNQVKFMCFATYANATPVRAIEEDELFLGFFLGADNDTLVALPGFVELIAWDRTKKVYNFWELLGPDWHYRGDSNDVLANVAKLNLGGEGAGFLFERRSPTDRQPILRCSGCHTLGGPVMKELEAPHNDWWTAARELDLGPFQLRPGPGRDDPPSVATRLFREAADASNFSQQVEKGLDRLIAARAPREGGQTLKQRLRSLFSTMEMNLVSDGASFRDRLRDGSSVEIPRDFFADARLVPERRNIPVKASLYNDALREVGSRFAPGETPGLVESRHAFVVPARSYADNRTIDRLIEAGLLDDELVADVLAIDFTTPVFSRARAALIRFVPERASDAEDLRKQMIAALKQASKEDRAAGELLANLTEPARTAAFHRDAASAYLDACAKSAGTLEAIVDWLKVAAQRRLEIQEADTAKHPRGNITEPGFRVIFPVSEKVSPNAGQLRLDPGTGRASSSGGAGG